MKKKHKITLLVIGILLALSLMLSSSYALWVFNVSQESTNVVVSDCFEITFTEGSQAIHLTNSFPMKDGKGVYTTPYEFTLRNICEHAADISINLEVLNDSQIAGENLRVDVNGHIHTFGDNNYVGPILDNASSAAKFYDDTIAAGDSKSYNLRLWIKEDANNEDVLNKTLSSKITVKSTLRKSFTVSTLTTGKLFNKNIKKMVDGGNPYENTTNTSITSFVWSNEAPLDSDNAINVAANGSDIPIYAWFNNGVLFLNSHADRIYLNADSSNMFSYMTKVESIDLSHFDTSYVNNMYSMFYKMSSLKNIDLSHFDTSNVTNMHWMFGGVKSLEAIDVSNFNTSNVSDMSSMFSDMDNIISLDLCHFNTANVTDMSSMFYSLNNLVNLDFSSFDTSNVTNMSAMFRDSTKIPVLNVSDFDTSNVRNMNQMFLETASMGSTYCGLPDRKIVGLDSFDTSSVTDMGSMFFGNCSVQSLDVSSFNTSNVTNMDHMFYGIKSINTLDVSNFDTSKVTNMSCMFCNSTFVELDLNSFDTSNVTNMSYMFSYMYRLKKVNFSTFNTSNVTNMEGMFFNAYYLEDLDLSNFNTSKVTNMSAMFDETYRLKNLNISSFDTSNVVDMSFMFMHMHSIENLNLSNFDTSKVTSMSGMFYDLDLLTVLDLSSFDTSNVLDYSGRKTIFGNIYENESMFGFAESLTTIYVSNKWVINPNVSSTSVFTDNSNLVGGAGTIYDSNHTDVEYARVDDPANGKPGYFTLKTS